MPNRWFVGILAFIVPPLAFLYLSKKSWAAVYLILIIIVGVLDFYLDRYLSISGGGLMLSIGAVLHSATICNSIHDGFGERWFNRWWGVLTIPIGFLVFILFFRSFIFEPFEIPSESMLPTLKVGDHVVVNKIGYGLYGTFGLTLYQSDSDNKKPLRGEVFVLYPPHGDSVFIERIVGVPGDKVSFSNKQIVINGVPIKTEAIKGTNTIQESIGDTTYRVQYLNENNRFRDVAVTVPEGHYFVMGDNRDNSSDSRMWGMVPSDRIVGKMVLIW